METKNEKIIKIAIEIIRSNSNGIHYSELLRKIQEQFPDISKKSIEGTIWNLETKISEIYKPARGLFRHIIFKDIETKKEELEIIPAVDKVKEEDFYEPFGEWLVKDLEECNKAIPLGGNKFKDKWATPDVIGILKSRESDIIKIPTEIVSAEIKIDARNIITAFGQACSYKLFSHKSYIVVPKESSEEDLARLDASCRIVGIGLILFDIGSPKNPNFEIRVRATKHEPDMFYVNKNLKLIEDELFF